MADDPRVDALLEELLDSGGTPEDVCRDCPELLPQVRERLRRLRLVEDEVGALFPLSDTPEGTTAPLPPPTDLPQVPGDLRRFLAGERILARPVGRLERLTRWGRRNPLVALLLIALAVTGAVGLAAVLWQWRQATQVRDDANHRAQAEAIAHRAAGLGSARLVLDRGQAQCERPDGQTIVTGGMSDKIDLLGAVFGQPPKKNGKDSDSTGSESVNRGQRAFPAVIRRRRFMDRASPSR